MRSRAATWLKAQVCVQGLQHLHAPGKQQVPWKRNTPQGSGCGQTGFEEEAHLRVIEMQAAGDLQNPNILKMSHLMEHALRYT